MFTTDRPAEAEISGKGSPEYQAALSERVWEGHAAVENTLHPLADQILSGKMAAGQCSSEPCTRQHSQFCRPVTRASQSGAQPATGFPPSYHRGVA